MKVKFLYLIFICKMAILCSEPFDSLLIKNEIIELKSEGIAFIGSSMSEDDAKTFAINDAKRNALEKAGTYLESHTNIINYKIVKDEVVTFTGSLLKIEIISEKREIINKIFAYKIVIRATIDTKLLKNRITEIRKNNELKSQLEFQAERIKYLEQKINKFKDSDKNEVERIANALNANELFEKAYDAYYKGNYKTSIDFFNKALSLDSSNSYGLIGRACSFSAEGQFKKEKEDYYKIIKIKPKSITGYFNRAYAFSQLNMFKKAIEDYNIVFSVDSTNGRYIHSRGQVYLKNGNFQKAIDDFSRVIFIANTKIIDTTYIIQTFNDSEIIEFEYFTLESEKNEAYLKRCEAYIKMKKFDRALEDCNISLLWLPNKEAFYFRGLIYKKLGLYKKSVQDFNNFLEIVKRNNKNEFIKEIVGEVIFKKEIVKRNKKIDKVRKWIKDMGYQPIY